MQDDLWSKGRFVRIGNTGELLNLAGKRLSVQPFRIALDEHIERAFHMHLDKIRNPSACLIPDGSIRRNGRDDRDYAVARQQFADEGDASDVLVPIFLAETETPRQTRSNDVTIQNFHPLPCP